MYWGGLYLYKETIIKLFIIRAYLSKLYLLEAEMIKNKLDFDDVKLYQYEIMRIRNELWSDRYRKTIKEFDYPAIDLCIDYISTCRYKNVNEVLDYLTTFKWPNTFKPYLLKAQVNMKNILLGDEELQNELIKACKLDDDEAFEKINLPLYQSLMECLDLTSVELNTVIKFNDNDDDEYWILYYKFMEERVD